MKVGIGNDHGATQYKQAVIDLVSAMGHEVVNYGTDETSSCDYPVYGQRVAQAVRDKEVDCGIVMCGSGIGISIAANKVKGIRCALCTDTTMARLCREHNDANVLAMGARTTGLETCLDIVRTFLTTEFSQGERHQNRIRLISEME